MLRYRELKDYELSSFTSTNVKNTGADVNNMLNNVQLTYHTPEFLRLYSRILDEGRNYRTVKDRWKSCQHYESRVVDDTPFNSAGRIPWVTWSSNDLRKFTSTDKGIDRLVVAGYRNFKDAFGAFGEHNALLPGMTEVVSGSQSFVPKPTGLSTLVSASLKTMLPHVKAELSLINSVIELKDFKSLPHALSSYYGTIKKLGTFIKEGTSALGRNPFSLIRKSFNPDQGLTLREMLHSTADGYLQAKFNLLPFLDDVRKVFLACTKLSKTMNSLTQNQGRPRKKHFSFQWLPAQFTGANRVTSYQMALDQFAGTENNGDPVKTGVHRYYGHSVRVTREVVVDQPAIFHAEIEYQYWLSQYQNEHARLLTLLDSLGVNLSPAIIWNAIPWSFVVDWVFGVSRYLGDRKVINMEPVVCIRRYCWSWETSRKIKVFFEDLSPNDKPACPRTYLPDLYETIYRRDIDMPAHSNPLYADGLSGTELSLGAALVTTRAWHPTRGRR
jgi:hypothetical protein